MKFDVKFDYTLVSNETWSGEVFILGDVTIPSGKALTIQPGTTIEILNTDKSQMGSDTGKCEIIVYGSLVAGGTSSQNIKFTRKGTSGYWRGIDIRDGGSVDLDYTIIEYSQYGLYTGESSASVDIDVDNCTFQNNYYYGIDLVNWSGSASISSSEFKGGRYGIRSVSGSDTIYVDSCTFNSSIYSSIYVQNTPLVFLDNTCTDISVSYGMEVSSGVSGRVRDSSFKGDYWGINITGGSVSADFGDSLGTYGDNNIWDGMYAYSGNDTIKAEMNYWRDSSGNLTSPSVTGPIDAEPYHQSEGKLAVFGRRLPEEFSLSQNYPNPFNPETVISYGIPPSRGRVVIDIYNIVGQRVRVLVDGRAESGYHSVIWDGRDEEGRDVSSGIYFLRMSFEGRLVDARKMVLIR